MNTKEYVSEQIAKWEDIIIKPTEKCILCNKWNYWDIHIIKLPEWVEFCLSCADWFEDNITKWRWVYQVWKWFILEDQ